MFAAAYAVNLLLTDEREPSVDDWQAAGHACGKAAAGIQSREFLPIAFVQAIPRWSAMLPPRNDRSDSITAARIRIQKKVYRAFKTLTEPNQRRKVVLMAYVSTPLERLQSELRFLDSAGNGLFDACVVDEDLNPFSNCRRALMNHLHDGKNGELRPLFAATATTDIAAWFRTSGR